MEMKLIKQLDEQLLANSITDNVKKMNAQGNYQWSDNYPKVNNFLNDIKLEQLYGFYENDCLVGLAALTENYEEHYYFEENDFQYSERTNKILYIHRMIRLKGNGFTKIGQKMLKSIIENQVHNYDAIQVDTNTKNIAMNRAIEKVGFKLVGSFTRKECISPKWNCYEFVRGEIL